MSKHASFNRRHSPNRRKTRVETLILVDGRPHPATILDVSYVGMKLAVADDLETGTAVTVRVLGEDIPAIVHWCKDARVGLHLLGRLERDTLVAIETAHDEFAEFR